MQMHFPGGPIVKTPNFHRRGHRVLFHQGTKIPQATAPRPPPKKRAHLQRQANLWVGQRGSGFATVRRVETRISECALCSLKTAGAAQLADGGHAPF